MGDSKPLVAGDKPDEPGKLSASEPSFQTDTTYSQCISGTRGKSGTNNILQLDDEAKSSVCVQASKGDIFIDAAKALQSECTFRCEYVRGEKKVYAESYVMNNTGTHFEFIDGTVGIYANADYTLNVVGTHKEEVKDQVITAQSQKVDVANAQTVSVYGDQTFKVGGNRVVHITGKEDRTVDGECKWFKKGHSFGINLSADELLKFSNSFGLTIGAKEEANLALSESLNVSGAFELNRPGYPGDSVS